jgi:hypothetical protein
MPLAKMLKCYRDRCPGEQLLVKDARKERNPRTGSGMTKEEAVRAGWKRDEFGWTCPLHR